MPDEPQSLRFSPEAERAFARYVADRKAGRGKGFEALCGEHPQLAGELRGLKAQWEQVAGALLGLLNQPLATSPLSEPSRPLELAGTQPVVETDFVRQLAEHSPPSSRYEHQGEIARGGMGAILKVWDKDLLRDLAMKVALDKEEAAGPRSMPRVDMPKLMRFLEEAQVTGQLDHPGVVPVHELGVDARGRVYFTMRLVKGRDLGEVLELLRRGQEGWTRTRVLGVVLKVCEAMAYAHSKGVVHRDLKPSNVMVGRFGEVYVMDWGLARVTGRADSHDLRLRAPDSTGALRTTRRDLAAETPDSPIVTMDGTVVGTPSYMPPEQAEGRIEELGPAADVYAVGAILYELLTGQRPYLRASSRPSPHTILAALLQGPPTPIEELTNDVPTELVSICERAMAREPAQRYADMSALAEDLSAFLEHRVVSAYRTGAVAELLKWVERNRALAAAIVGVFVAVVAGMAVSLVFKARSDRNAVLAETNAEIAKTNEDQARAEKARAEQNEVTAEAERKRAEEEADDVLRLSALQKLEDLAVEADRLWPAYPDNVGRYESWLERARELEDELPGHEEKLAELRSRAVPRPEADQDQHSGLELRPIGAIEASTGLFFTDAEDKWWHNQLVDLVDGLKAFADPSTGLFSSGTSPEHGLGVLKRLEFATVMEEQSVSGAEASRLWSEALASIASTSECPLYGGLRIPPQLGLLPIGQDPESGLWEFAHLLTGEAPARDPDTGQIRFSSSTGVILVLLPGGSYWMGAQSSASDGPNYDPQASDALEAPPRQVEIEPFFISKYEMSRGQWMRIAPPAAGATSSAELPAVNLSWRLGTTWLARAGLELPTEEQWEYAARAGTAEPWYVPLDQVRLAANLADTTFRDERGGQANEAWSDGFSGVAPVHALLPNSFGLHNTLGNVWEWTQSPSDGYAAKAEDPEVRVARGGCYINLARIARCAVRDRRNLDHRNDFYGVRPVLALER